MNLWNILIIFLLTTIAATIAAGVGDIVFNFTFWGRVFVGTMIGFGYVCGFLMAGGLK